MRSGYALLFAAILTGTGLAAEPAFAATERGRQAAKAPRAAEAVPQANARNARKPGSTRQEEARRPAAPAPRQAAAKPAPQRTAAAPQQARQAARPGMVRQAAAQTLRQPEAASRPMIRPAFQVGGGTAILPVAMTSGLSCVPFARMATGMEISGNARDWWYNAAGRYARGHVPERGAVLSFPSSGGMVSGHVAVVSRVVGPRHILIDHANWAGPGIRRGMVMRGVHVQDVSDRNDWTAVRVQVGHDSSLFGRTYATHGFIYNRSLGGRTLTTDAGGFEQLAETVSDPVSPHAARHIAVSARLLTE